MILNNKLPKITFKQHELQCFNWMFHVSPCFPVEAKKVRIITDPSKFYDSLVDRFQNAKKRISVASLYIGTGSLERRLLEVAKENVVKHKDLKFCVLLDYQRGTRGAVNSWTLLKSFVEDVPQQCSVSLYQTPRLHGAWSRVLPSRWNELAGLQHMKIYIADDSVLLSGANCSNDYFTQRQDRYVEVHDADLADYYAELIDTVSEFSRPCPVGLTPEVKLKPGSSRQEFIAEASQKMSDFLDRWFDKQNQKLSTSTENTTDTWIFPLVQMGDLDVTQDAQATRALLASSPPDSVLRLATGYFNLTGDYASTLLQSSQAKVSLLMAHPNANGFLGAAGAAGGIPFAYSLIAKKFWERVSASKQHHRIQLMEYQRAGWTFHAKGIWYYPAGSKLPWATLVGSANLGERSVRRDLEAQAAIFTVSPQLQEQLHSECLELHRHATECSEELTQREAPMWVRAAVGLFRNYF